MKKFAIGKKYGVLTIIDRAPDIVYSSGQKARRWVCECDKHHKIVYRDESVWNGKCPYCNYDRLLTGFNDIATLYPEIAQEWDYEKNGELKPTQFTPRSHEKVWWKCKKCGDSWQTQIYVRIKGHGCPYCTNHKASSYNNLMLAAPQLAAEWNYEKNGSLTPRDVAPYSSKKVWWRCSKGHEWIAPVENRFSGRGCRICSCELKSSFPEQAVKYYLAKAFNTLNRFRIEKWELDIYLPDFRIGIEYDGLAWHLTNEKLINREMRKNEFFSNSQIDLIRVKETKQKLNDSRNTIYLEIAKSGYTYSLLDDAIIRLLKLIEQKTGKTLNIDVNHQRDRTDILNSYINLKKENSLGTEVDDSYRFWDYEKNKGLTPEQFTKASNHIVWWKCPVCGGSWEKSIIAFGKGDRCPYCSGHRLLPGFNDLQTMNPELVKEWNYNKNLSITPDSIYAKSSKKVWWICSKGHEWRQAPQVRISKGVGCPYCGGKEYLLSGPNEKQTLQWNKLYDEAKEYHSSFGNLEVPISYISPSGAKLGMWIHVQRTRFNNGNLIEERKAKLDQIGMIWVVKRGPKK